MALLPFAGRAIQQPESRIPEILIRQGDAAAAGADRSGQIWSGALQSLGQQAGQAIEAHQMAKRDAAWVRYVESGEWQTDPKAAYAMATKVWGPKEGPKQFQALESVSRLSADKRNPEQDRKDLGVMIGAMGALQGPARARLYPQASALAKRVYPDVQLDAEYNEERWPEFDAIGAQLRGEKPKEVKTRSMKYRKADGTEVEEVVEDAPGLVRESAPPVKERKLRLVETTDPKTGRKVTRLADEDELTAGVPAHVEPKAATKPQLERIETTDDSGKAVTRFVVAKEGASYPKPSGAGKPATGQQRRALGFFNRGKEAQEIASALEEGKQINPTRIKFTPEILNITQSNPNQAYLQAQRAFTEARLRKDSGAAVPEHEYKTDALTYFAQPGDSEATKNQKRAGRNAILAGIAFESGDALKEFYGDEADGMIEGYKKGSQSGGPRKGERRTIGGKLAEWDGKGWLPVR